MFSNGVIGFLNPNYNSWCCSGFDLRTANGTPFNFAIMPLQTDLLNYSGRFLTEGTTQYQRYKWENISEFGRPENFNTFGVEIRPSGYIGMHYEKVNISSWRNVTIGITGDTTQGQYIQHYHGSGFTTNEIFSYITESTGNQCLTNPLSSPTCAGYQEAYTAQQCSINPLYSPSCPNYQQAYFDQQCSLNPLYDSQCQGYAQAYHDQQCSLNPLYSNTCIGYESVYFNQQCSLNPLYNPTCNGYQQAYFTYQCTQNPLYNNQCVGYQQAYLSQQCGISQLYSTQCPNYQQAYFNEQCRLNPLYDKTCSGYAEAYALANIVPTAPSQTISTTTPSVQVSTTGTISVETPVVANPVVNEVITRKETVAVATIKSEPKVETKVETKKEEKNEEKPKQEIRQVKKEEPKSEITATAPQIIDIPQIKVIELVDNSFGKLFANVKLIRENPRLSRMLNDNDQKHRSMVDEQWRR